MALSEQLQEKIDFYEKFYFALDEPVPFKNGLYIYPVLVKDYYKFYTYYSCLTMDKNTKKQKYMDKDLFTGQEVEKVRDVSNPKGLSMSYMAYLIEMMEDEDFGRVITNNVTSLLELVLHEENGLFCPNCFHGRGSADYLEPPEWDPERDDYARGGNVEKGNEVLSFKKIARDLYGKEEAERHAYFAEHAVCPHCGGIKREVFSIKDSGVTKKLCVYNTELLSQDFEELKAVVSHYNILGYDGDRYIDPDLKEELEKKARLQNKDYTSPTLEKQLVCVASGSNYTIEGLKDVTMRKLSYLLKVIDRKAHYFAQMQGAYSGMVKFKKDPEHWIYGDNGRDVSKEITMLNDFKNKFKGAI